MSGIYGVELLDGNIYQVQYSGNSNSVTGASFGTVFNEINSPQELDYIFNEAANKYGVDVNLLKAVAYAESGFDANATSSCGAQGIMQLMPFVSESLGISDPYDAAESINGGASILASLLDQFEGNVTLALAAYNAGSGAVAKYGGVPPYKETLNYINKINSLLGGALDNDSTTIKDNNTATVIESGNVSISRTNMTNADLTNLSTMANSAEIFDNTFSKNYVSSLVKSSDNEKILELLKALNSNSGESSTYKDSIMQDLVSIITGNSSSDDTTDISNLLTSTNEDSSISLLSDYLGTLTDEELESLSVDSSNIDFGLNTDIIAMSGYLNNVNNILQTDLYSLYEAQSSVMSPVLAKLYDIS